MNGDGDCFVNEGSPSHLIIIRRVCVTRSKFQIMEITQIGAVSILWLSSTYNFSVALVIPAMTDIYQPFEFMRYPKHTYQSTGSAITAIFSKYHVLKFLI